MKATKPPKKGSISKRRRVKRKGGVEHSLNKFSANLERILFSTKEMQDFLEDLATLIDDGVPANKAVEVMDRLVKRGPEKQLTSNILLKVAQGKPLADGMVGWLPQHIVELVRAGEQGGTLGQNIRAAAESLSRKTSTFASLSSSLVYPIIVLVTGILVIIYMKSSVFKQFASIEPISEWPKQGQDLVMIATFFQEWWWVCLLVLFGFMFAINRLLNLYIGKGRVIIDQLPALSLYRKVTAARFMETLGLLISNGVVFKQSLKIMQFQASPYLGYHLMLMERRLSRGQSNIADVLATGMVEDADVIRLRAIAEAKGFEHALVRLGRQAAERGVQTIEKFGKVLGGLLLAAGAGLAAYMITGIYAVGSSLAT